MKDHVLFSEDFSGFAIGEFPYDPDHTATGEYHYVVEKGDHATLLKNGGFYSELWNSQFEN